MSESDTGYIYVVQAENGDVKIGRTESPKRRLDNIRSSSPLSIEVLETVEVPDPKFIEQTLHDAYSSANIRGEWFSLSEGEIDKLIEVLTGDGLDDLREELIEEHLKKPTTITVRRETKQLLDNDRNGQPWDDYLKELHQDSANPTTLNVGELAERVAEQVGEQSVTVELDAEERSKIARDVAEELR